MITEVGLTLIAAIITSPLTVPVGLLMVSVKTPEVTLAEADALKFCAFTSVARSTPSKEDKIKTRSL
jgi:hypothetical protein